MDGGIYFEGVLISVVTFFIIKWYNNLTPTVEVISGLVKSQRKKDKSTPLKTKILSRAADILPVNAVEIQR